MSKGTRNNKGERIYAKLFASTIRCLEPSDVKEHTFFSPDRRRYRICKKCRSLLDSREQVSHESQHIGHIGHD